MDLAPGGRIEVDTSASSLGPRKAVPVRLRHKDRRERIILTTAAVETTVEPELLRQGRLLPRTLRALIGPAQMNEASLRELLTERGRSLYERGYAHGSSGNLSVRVDDGFLVTPTGSCLGRLDPGSISRLDASGRHVAGDKPSKEAFLHLAMYAERPNARAIVHLHCTCAVAVSCLVHSDPSNVMKPLTAYHVMRVGRVPLVPYFRPGDRALAEAVRAVAGKHRAVLLANHGPVVSGSSLDEAGESAEELEATAKLMLLLDGKTVSTLNEQQISELERDFAS